MNAAEDATVNVERLAMLTALLDSESHRIKVWKWSWVSVYSAAAVGQVIPAILIDNHATRTDLWVGSISAVIGVLGMALNPLDVPSAEDLPSDPQAALVEVERRIKIGAKNQRLGVSWIAHAGNVGVNLVIGLILGVGYSHWEAAGISFGVGLLVGEATLFTQPTRLARLPEFSDAGVLKSLRLSPVVGPRQNGVALSFVW